MVLNKNFKTLDRKNKEILGVKPVYQIISGNLREVMLAGSFLKQAEEAGIRLDDIILAPSLVPTISANAAMNTLPWTRGGIDLNTADMGITITKEIGRAHV